MNKGIGRPTRGKIISTFPFSIYQINPSTHQPESTQSIPRIIGSQQQQFRCQIKGTRLQENQHLQRVYQKQDIKIVRLKMINEHSHSIPIISESIESKKTNFRRRQNKIIKTKKVQPKVKVTENKSLIIFYRYQLVSLFTLLGRRQDYMNSLKLKNNENTTDPLKSNEIEQRLKKLIQSKGKDKGRTKFNHLINEQLRSLKYKPKITYQSLNKKNKAKSDLEDEQEEQEEVIQQKNNKLIDFQTWKRQNGIGLNQKVFIIKGGYYQLRKALLDKGWYQNEDVWSPFFDLKWTTRICDINYQDLKSSQAVNHFNNNHHLTSKYGLTRRLRTLALGHSIDTDKFYPRCFDLGDQVDFENFVENFKYGFAESVTRRFLVDKKRYEGLQLKIRVATDILRRRTLKFTQIINNINQGQFPTITNQQWLIITQTLECDQQKTKEMLSFWRKNESESIDDPDYLIKVYQKIDGQIRKYLQILKGSDPQIDMNGWRNVWIVKPNFLSRGRGIRCFNNLYDISDYCLGRDVQFVVQKYIENPLLVEGRKFDIRQWVLIQDYNPPKIWFYEQCYIRFCGDEYSLDNIYNRFIHLTNNSIQKYNKNHVIEKSMWSMKQFSEFIGEQKWSEIKQKMMNIVVWSIKSCEGHVIGKKGSCQLVGYDFMIDQNLNPWLIEINMSPSMDYSTPITKKLVKMVLQDTAKVISNNKKNKDTGLFKCIYEDKESDDLFNLYKF